MIVDQLRAPFDGRRGRRPPRTLVECIAAQEGQRAGLPVATVLGASHAWPAVAARRAAWRRLIHDHGCSINGVATVWGCERRDIQRALKAAAHG